MIYSLTKLSMIDSEETRRLYKIIRRDTMQDVSGLILSASVETGVCLLRLDTGLSQEFFFGPRGFLIVLADKKIAI